MMFRYYGEKRERLTRILIVINVLVYVAAGVIGGNLIVISDNILVVLGQFNYLVLRYGMYYQIFSAMFIHLNILHLGLNMLWLYFLGRSVERLFSYKDYLIIYFGGGLLGNILTLVMFPPYTISAGASGAIFSLFGALVMFSGAFGGDVKNALFYAMIIFLMNMGFGVNYIAHAAGLIVGLLYGYYKGKAYARRIVYYSYSYY